MVNEKLKSSTGQSAVQHTIAPVNEFWRSKINFYFHKRDMLKYNDAFYYP